MSPQTAAATDAANVERLVECDKFVLDRVFGRQRFSLGGGDRFHIIAVLEGELRIGETSVSKGETVLLPASCGQMYAESNDGTSTLLDMYLP